jgi:hypothetical protein
VDWLRAGFHIGNLAPTLVAPHAPAPCKKRKERGTHGANGPEGGCPHVIFVTLVALGGNLAGGFGVYIYRVV